ncbi:MAG: hypothetical protein WBQ55_07560, partial [Xanthobacteraceae bacterium]
TKPFRQRHSSAHNSALGPHLFADYAVDLARRAAAGKPSGVLEIAAGTPIPEARQFAESFGPCTPVIAEISAGGITDPNAIVVAVTAALPYGATAP